MNSRWIWWTLLFLLLLAWPLYASEYRVYQVGLIASMSIVSLGLVLVIGIAGQISLAQGAFSAVGAYGATLFAINLGITPWLGIPLAALVAGASGYVIGLGTMRLAGHYLALVTMAVTAIVEVGLIHWTSLTGGALGLAVMPLAIGETRLTSGVELFYVVVPVAFAMFVVAQNILDSRIGRAFHAIRQSEVAAKTLGVNVLHYKSVAFALSAVFGSIGGSFQALQSTYLDPHQFGIIHSVMLVAIIIIGGFRSLAGAILGSAIFILVPELLGGFEFYKGLVFGGLLLLTIVLFPSGLAGLAATAFESVRRFSVRSLAWGRAK